jgi:hypothetical protein
MQTCAGKIRADAQEVRIRIVICQKTEIRKRRAPGPRSWSDDRKKRLQSCALYVRIRTVDEPDQRCIALIHATTFRTTRQFIHVISVSRNVERCCLADSGCSSDVQHADRSLACATAQGDTARHNIAPEVLVAPVWLERRLDDERTRVTQYRIVGGKNTNVRFTYTSVNATDRRYSAVAFGNQEECFDRARAKIATVAVPAGDLSLSYHHVVGAVAIFNHQAVIAEGTSFPQGARRNTFTLSGQTFPLADADPALTARYRTRSSASPVRSGMV